MKLRPKLGPTGTFPRGKFDADDMGGLVFAIGVKDRTVLVDFGAPVSRIGMSREEAIALGEAIIAKAKTIRTGEATS